jgi:hypothetical protein
MQALRQLPGVRFQLLPASLFVISVREIILRTRGRMGQRRHGHAGIVDTDAEFKRTRQFEPKMLVSRRVWRKGAWKHNGNARCEKVSTR